MHRFERQSPMPVPADALAAWHFRAGALDRLLPPWQSVEVEEPLDRLEDGARAVLLLKAGPIRVRWIAVHEDVEPGVRFRDRQERGPFGAWVHEHRFEPDGLERSRLVDAIDWMPPFGPFGALGRGKIERDLDHVFAFRHRRTRNDLVRHAEADAAPMRVAITGASGFVGGPLAAFLATGGHEVVRLVRRAPRSHNEVRWDPANDEIDAAGLEGVDAVVHLAGESVVGRWTEERKRRIVESRVRGTELIARTLAALDRKPKVLVSASASGWYGNRPESAAAPLAEDGDPGEGFLAETCVAWEAAADAARDAGIRVVHPRIGVVLDPSGAALAKMLTPFRLGAGGPIGSGAQGFPWIARDDLVAMIHAMITDDRWHGPANAVAPQPISQKAFARTLGSVLRRPAFAPAPAAVLRLVFGEMAQAVLLDGAFLRPARALDLGFRFDFPELDGALRFMLGRLKSAETGAEARA